VTAAPSVQGHSRDPVLAAPLFLTCAGGKRRFPIGMLTSGVCPLRPTFLYSFCCQTKEPRDDGRFDIGTRRVSLEGVHVNNHHASDPMRWQPRCSLTGLPDYP